MKKSTVNIVLIVLFLIACSLYRVWDGRPWGFTPVIAIAIFAGAFFRDKKWAFLVPLSVMLFSDAIYQLLYVNGLSEIQGFYKGQVLNYALIISTVFVGILMRRIEFGRILVASIAAPVLYFLLSNFAYWAGAGTDITTQLPLSRSWAGLVQSNVQATPFFRGLLEGTVVFSVLFFAGYYLLQRTQASKAAEIA